MKNEIPDLYCINSEFAEFKFSIVTLQYMLNTSDASHSIYKLHRFEYYAMYLITEDTGWHYIDYKKYPLKKGSFLFLSKNQVQVFEKNDKIQGFVILFSEEFLQKGLSYTQIKNYVNLFNYHIYSPLLELNEANYNDLLSLTERIKDEYEHEIDEMQGKIISTFLNALLFKTERITREKYQFTNQTQHDKKFILFKDLLEENLVERKDAKFYADRMNISYKHLNDICKTVISKTAKQFITNYLILEIKRYLASSSMSVKEIAYKIGFDEPTNLQKVFKRETGKSALQFRQLYK